MFRKMKKLVNYFTNNNIKKVDINQQRLLLINKQCNLMKDSFIQFNIFFEKFEKSLEKNNDKYTEFLEKQHDQYIDEYNTNMKLIKNELHYLDTIDPYSSINFMKYQ